MDKLTFNEKDHSYWVNGRRLVSVTQCLSILGRWEAEPFYLNRGRLVHLACEYYDRDILDESTVDPEIRPYLDAYVKFRKDTGFEPTLIEHRLYHPSNMYAGTLDRIGSLNGNQVLLDLKSGVKVRVDELQGAAYWELCLVNNIPVKKVFDLYLSAEGTYKLEPIDNPKRLLPTFLNVLGAYRWKEGL